MKKCTRGFPYWEGCWAYVSCISGEVLLALDNCACNITTRRSGLCIGFESKSRSQTSNMPSCHIELETWETCVNAIENRASVSRQQL